MKSMRKYKGHLALTYHRNRIRAYTYSQFDGSRNNSAIVLSDNDVMLFVCGTHRGDFIVLTRFGLKHVSASDMVVLRWITC